MVSFQCEGCGDVLTKKKLDAHRGRCRTASYTCLDCMTNFYGTDYRTHTSCVSEDQKYQGHLYKDKSAKQTKKTVQIDEANQSNSSKPRKAYVEDAPDVDTGSAITVVDVPPEAPAAPPPPPPAPPSTAPPPAQPPVNVFDFLVPSDSPEAPKGSLVAETAKPKKSVKMDYTPSVVGSEISSKHDKKVAPKHDPDYDTKGFSYGADPIPTAKKRDRPKVEYFTPAPKDLARDLERHMVGDGKAGERPSRKSTDKKRKRHSSHHLEEFELARRPSRDASEDAIMSDAPHPSSAYTPSFHTGLTGGLTRLLSKDSYHSEDDEDQNNRYKDTPAPSRSRPQPSQTYIVKDSRAHAEQPSSRPSASGPSSSSTAMVKAPPNTKNRHSPNESRPRKHHRASEYHNEGTATTTSSTHRHHKRSKHRSPSTNTNTNTTTTGTTTRPSLRAIEYHQDGHNATDGAADQQQQMILYRSRAEFFMSFVTKGPESESGTSMNKALKRYHRERGSSSGGGGDGGGGGGGERSRGRGGKEGKDEEEKELWKGLRLRRNSRGEVVVFF